MRYGLHVNLGHAMLSEMLRGSVFDLNSGPCGLVA